tara:strand:- start:548 stop:1147 length:600 start_codon:yes stop_codon:yes gene_type:complete
MEEYKRHREMEVYLTTYDGTQHLRLHGWLKRNDTLIKSENIVDQDDYFGVFMVYITENQLNKLKENNTESSLFMNLEVMSTESERWNLFQDKKKKKDKDNMFEKIQDFMFSFQIRDKGDIQKFLIQANETSLALFKQNKDFITDYIETEELTYGDKVKDLDIMIETFVEEERYEDCAILVKIKKKMKKYYLKKQKIEKL